MSLKFVDLQINGCWGVDFNSDGLTIEAWSRVSQQLAQAGTAKFLPTLITDDGNAMLRRIDSLVRCFGAGAANPDHAVPVGIHLEGPFLSPESGYIGAHPKAYAVPASLETAKRMVESGQGWVRMVTLAPEADPKGIVTQYLADQKILVAAGHTDATCDQLRCALDHGLTCFTHLGNGCPAVMPRHDNIIHRVMRFRDRLTVTLIADGFHLPYWLLAILIDWFGEDRAAIVSDAISAAGLPPGLHRLGNQQVWVGEDGVPRSDDRTHFVGSGATMDVMYRRMLAEGTWAPKMLEKLFVTNPSRLLRLA